MKKKLIGFGRSAAILIALAFAALQFTACSEDKNTEHMYSMGFTSMSASGGDFLVEMKLIEDTFKEALGTSENTFKRTGTEEECDAYVVAACAKAKEKLKDQTWSFDAEFNVTRVLENSVVYTYQVIQEK